jgi:hypothetical protein
LRSSTGEQGSEGWQIFIVDVDVFADGDGVHGAAIFAFDGDGTFAFAAVAARGFGAFLFLFLGEDFLHDGCSVIRNWWLWPWARYPDFRAGEVERQPERGGGGGVWKWLITGGVVSFGKIFQWVVNV